MKKVYVSIALASAMAISANAVEVNPFGHLGAFYHQGFGGLNATQNNDKVQKAYGNISARVGLDIGLSKSFSIGLGGWGAYPFYSTGDNGSVGKVAIPSHADVSDAYGRYDGGRLSFVLGRFDIGQFFLGQDGKNYTGVDWIYGNVQGGAIHIDGGAVSLWGYWRNSQLGAGQTYNRMGYELSSFHTYQGMKGSTGELVSGGVDIDFGIFKVSPFATYLTQGNTNSDTLNAGAKALLELGNNSVKSYTTLRAVFGMSNLVANGNSQSGLTLWLDEEVRINDLFKVGAGYISQSNGGHLLNYGDRARFYGYRGGMNGPNYGVSPLGNTYYVFGGMTAKRVTVDLLYSGGDHEEISAVGALKVWEKNDKMHLSLGAGYVGTGNVALGNVANGKWQHSALAFAKFGF